MKVMSMRRGAQRLGLIVAAAVGAIALALASGCGGGEGLATVSNLSASNVLYGRNMIVTVSGQALDKGINLDTGGGCGAITVVPGGTDATQSFSCRVTSIGTLRIQVLRGEGPRLAELILNTPLPQVSMTLTQGTATGTIVVELDPIAAPKTVNNFLDYVNAGYYRNTLFHRVIKDQVAQAGGFIAGSSPSAALTGKTSTNLPIVLESNRGLKNLRGSISMAREALPDTATAQFYFNLQDNPRLDYVSAEEPGYAVFGKIIQGLEVMDVLGAVATGLRPVAVGAVTQFLVDVPVDNVVITAASQIK